MRIKKSISRTLFIYLVIYTTIPILIGTHFIISRTYKRFREETKIMNEYYITTQKINLKHEVEKVVNLINHMHSSICETPDEMITLLADLRFGEDGYFFGSTFQGDPLFSNGKVTVGTGNLWELTDKKGTKIIQLQKEAAQSSEGGYIKYYWNKLNDEKLYPKLSYTISIDGLQWMIGAGIYIDEIDSRIMEKEIQLKNKVRSDLLFMGFIFVVLLIILVIFAQYFSIRIKQNFDVFSFFFKESDTKSKNVDLEKLNFIEFKELAKSANHMIESRKLAELKTNDKSKALAEQFKKSEKQRIATLSILSDLNAASKDLKAEIIEREVIQQALEERERTYRTLINNLPGFAYRCNNDKNWTMNFVSSGCLEVTGYVSEDFIDNKNVIFNEIILKEHQERIWKETQSKLQTQSNYEIEYQIITKSNKTRWVWEKGCGIYSGKGKLLFLEGFITDISDRKKAEEKLISSEERHRKLIQTAAEGFWMINAKAETINVNESLCKILGYTEEEMIGRTPFEFCDKKNKLIFKEQIMKSESLKHRTYEIELIKKNGDLVPTLFNATSMFDAKIKRTGSFAFVTDISHQKNAEEEIKKNLKEKETLLKELYHRTKNNMQVISSMLKMQSRQTENEYVKNTFMEITNRINSMSLVHQKLYQAKDLSKVNLNNYIHDLARMLTRSYSSPANKVSFKYELDDVFVLIDTAVPLGLVLNELVTNVFKHAFPDERTGTISIRLYKDENNTINIHIHDDGIGLQPDLNLYESQSMGIQTMFNLVKYQLRGDVNYKVDNGLKWHLRLKSDLHKPRV